MPLDDQYKENTGGLKHTSKQPALSAAVGLLQS